MNYVVSRNYGLLSAGSGREILAGCCGTVILLLGKFDIRMFYRNVWLITTTAKVAAPAVMVIDVLLFSALKNQPTNQIIKNAKTGRRFERGSLRLILFLIKFVHSPVLKNR